jgi:hypothetical protein
MADVKKAAPKKAVAKKPAAKKAVAKKPAAKKAVAKKPAAKKAAAKKPAAKKPAAKKPAAKKAPAKKAAKPAAKKAPAKKAAPKKAEVVKASPSSPAPVSPAAKKPAITSSLAADDRERVGSAGTERAVPAAMPAAARRTDLRLAPSPVESFAQFTTFPFNIQGTTPDGRVYYGTGTILISSDRHTRRASYTVTFDTITYRGTALLRGSLDEKNLVIVLDYHERPFHKGMVVSIHEQDPKTGKFKGRLLFQGRQEIGEETITLT